MSVFNQKAKAGAAFSVPPIGNHPGVFVAMIDLGTHNETYKQKDGSERKADARKLFVVWELTGEPDGTSGHNHLIGKVYTASFGQKSGLRKLVEAVTGKTFSADEEFEVTKLLNKPCLVNVVANGADGQYRKAESVTALPKGTKVAKPKRTPFKWELGGVPYPAPEWIPYIFGEKATDIILRCNEMKGKPSANGEQPAPVGDAPDDEWATDPPF